MLFSLPIATFAQQSAEATEQVTATEEVEATQEVIQQPEMPPSGPADTPDSRLLFGAIDLTALSFFVWQQNGWAILLLMGIAYFARGVVPPHIMEMMYNINTRLIDELHMYADRTTTPIDNYLVEDGLRRSNEHIFNTGVGDTKDDEQPQEPPPASDPDSMNQDQGLDPSGDPLANPPQN